MASDISGVYGPLARNLVRNLTWVPIPKSSTTENRA